MTDHWRYPISTDLGKLGLRPFDTWGGEEGYVISSNFFQLPA